MDPRLRFQPGAMVNPSGQLTGGFALRSASGLVPSLSSGQGFHTVESLHGAMSGLQDGNTQLSGYDATRGLGGGAFGMAHLGFDAASLGVNQFMAQQAGMQKLVAAAPSPLMAPGYSYPGEMNAGGVITQGAAKPAPVYIYQPYVQPEIPRAPVRYVAPASVVPAVGAARRLQEYDHMREREDERERERDWKISRLRERREDWALERRRNIERRREFERSRELDRRRDLERRQDIDYRNRVEERLKKKDKGLLKKGVSQPLASTVRQSNLRDETNSKGPLVHGQKKAWCALCQVSCITQEMLGNHLAGKKHHAKMKAEEQKKESEQPPNVDANKEGGVKATTDATKANAGKGKMKAKAKIYRIRKSGLQDSNVDASKADVKLKDTINKTAQESDKVQALAMEPGTIEPKIMAEKVEVVVKDLGSEGEPKGVNVEGVGKETGVEVFKLGGDTNSPVSKIIDESIIDEMITSIISEDMAGGTEKELSNGNLTKKVLANQDIVSSISSESPVNHSVLGKRNLEADEQPASAKKTPHSKNKRAGASPTVGTESVRCEVCKVTCRNAAVYETHLKGEKHSERLKKGQCQTPASKNAKATNLADINMAEEAILNEATDPEPTLGESGVGQQNVAAETA